MAETFTISELAREFGVTTRTIRHYEDEGLLNPERDGINRVFSNRDRVRLKLALRGKRLGFTLQEMSRATRKSSLRNSWRSSSGAAPCCSSSVRTSK
jgi:DNA-binding transcriptional MerR regulator